MEIRQLTVRDVFRVAGILTKVKQPEPTGDAQGFGMRTILAALRDTEDETMAWLAYVGQVNVEVFATMPPSAVMDVIEGIMAQDGSRDFFARLLKLLGVKLSSSGSAGQTTPSSDSASVAT